MICKELDTLNRTVVFLSLVGTRNRKYGPVKCQIYPTVLSEINIVLERDKSQTDI